MMPKDKDRRQTEREPVSLPSLANHASMKWEIQDFNYQVEAFKASIDAAKQDGELTAPNSKQRTKFV